MVAAARLVASPILHASVIGHERAAYTHVRMLLLLEKERQGEKTGNHPDWSLSSRQILILPVCPVQNVCSSGVNTSDGFFFMP